MAELLGIPLFPFAVYDFDSAASYLGISKRTLYRAANAGFLKTGPNRITGRALIRWVEAGMPTGRNAADVASEFVSKTGKK